MAKVWGLAAVAVFVLSAAFHCATFIPALRVWTGFAWPLHLGAMAVFAAMVLSFVAQGRRQRKSPRLSLLANWRAANQQNKEFKSRLLGAVPPWLRVVCCIAFIYTMINFALFASLMEGGTPAICNGKYCLQNHGRLIRNITQEEFNRFRAYQVRGFSGHWMFFSLIPAVYFLVVRPRLNDSAASEPDPAN